MSTSNVYSYRSGVTASADVSGYDVEATDGHIGKIDEATNETSASYVVVDTGSGSSARSASSRPASSSESTRPRRRSTSA